jgi:hypothetical protein
MLVDAFPGVQPGHSYAYRVTVVRSDGSFGSAEWSHLASGAVFTAQPLAVVNGNTVRLAADVSYCSAYTQPVRCDPWMMEFRITSSTVGFTYTSIQAWVNNHDPILPASIPGGIDGTFVFTIPGVPAGTHTFSLTALYQPDIRVNAGSVTVVVP